MIRLLFAATLVFSTPVLAQTATKKKSDPNKVICRSEPVIGSRLETKRRCMTAQQWSDLQHDTRETIERVQRFDNKGG